MIWKIGETLTKGVLEKQFKGSEILEQVNIKMDGASTVADFVVVKDGNVVGVFESKVNGSKLSNGQGLFFKDGEVGTLSGTNAAALKGVTDYISKNHDMLQENEIVQPQGWLEDVRTLKSDRILLKDAER